MNIIFVGKEWKFQTALKEEIFRYIRADYISYLDSFDIEFTPKDDTLIVTNDNTYPLVARIIARKTGDDLIVKDNFLTPQNSKFSKGSFIVNIDGKNVNVILLKDTLPEIFLITPEYEKINIFKMDKDTALMLVEPIFNAYKINFTVIENEASFIEMYTEPLDEVVKKEIKEALPFIIFGDIFEFIIKNLPPKKITFAESCTGGLIASTLTKYSGSSAVFDGSVVTYANEIKNSWLGVSNDTLKHYGAVSEQCVKEMLVGAIEIAKSDYAIAVSGIAGPTGDTPTKPVGTVFIGVADRKSLIVEEFRFKGDRNYIQYQAMLNGYRMFINFANLFER